MKKNKDIVINVFGEMVTLVHEPTLVYDDQHLHGLCSASEKKIYYSDHANITELMATIIHEIIHYVFYRTGIRQTALSHDLEEIICENVSRSLVENFNIDLKENRKLILKKKKVKKKQTR